MQRRLSVIGPWRYRDRVRGSQVLAPGVYAVPDQVGEQIARLCVDQGMGRLYEVQMPDAVRSVQPAQRHVPEPPRRPKRGPKRRKGSAPENKIVHAEENKSSLV